MSQRGWLESKSRGFTEASDNETSDESTALAFSCGGERYDVGLWLRVSCHVRQYMWRFMGQTLA